MNAQELITLWINMTRPITQHLLDKNAERWYPSIPYYGVIANIEFYIAKELKISSAEAKVMLLNKKKDRRHEIKKTI